MRINVYKIPWLCWLFFIQISSLCSQTIILKFSDASRLIPFVNVYDSSKEINKASNESGILQLKSDNYNLKITHVSYNPYYLKISAPSKDTIINVLLQERNNTLGEVIVSIKKIKPKVFEAGAYNQSNLTSVILNQDIKIGAYLNGFKDDKRHYIKTIKFKLKKDTRISKENYVMEIKLYEVQGQSISLNTINRKPIYVNSTSLTSNNEISLQEQVYLDYDGLFISFEIPYINSTNLPRIAFSGNYVSDNCVTYTKRNNIPWEENILNRGCGTSPLSEKHCKLNISVRYQNEE